MNRPKAEAHRRGRGAARRALVASLVVCALAASSCSNLAIRRTSETAGTFKSTGRSFTLLSWDMPRAATQIARGNISDASQPNMVVTKSGATDWGAFDWVLEIIGVRSAWVEGTWGY